MGIFIQHQCIAEDRKMGDTMMAKENECQAKDKSSSKKSNGIKPVVIKSDYDTKTTITEELLRQVDVKCMGRHNV